MDKKEKNVIVIKPGETIKFGKSTYTNNTKQTKYY